MKVRAIHYHNPGGETRTLCGHSPRKVEWTADRADVTCNNCLRSLRASEDTPS